MVSDTTVINITTTESARLAWRNAARFFWHADLFEHYQHILDLCVASEGSELELIQRLLANPEFAFSESAAMANVIEALEQFIENGNWIGMPFDTLLPPYLASLLVLHFIDYPYRSLIEESVLTAACTCAWSVAIKADVQGIEMIHNIRSGWPEIMRYNVANDCMRTICTVDITNSSAYSKRVIGFFTSFCGPMGRATVLMESLPLLQ